MELSILSTAEQRFLLIPIYWKREPVFLSLHLDMVWTELHSHMFLQQGPRFYIPLQSICCLFAAYCREFCNREPYDGFVLPVEKEFQKPPIWLINHGKEFWEFVLFIKLFVVTKMEILKNTLERITTRHWIRPCLNKSIRGRLPIHFTVWKLTVPTKQ